MLILDAPHNKLLLVYVLDVMCKSSKGLTQHKQTQRTMGSTLAAVCKLSTTREGVCPGVSYLVLFEDCTDEKPSWCLSPQAKELEKELDAAFVKVEHQISVDSCKNHDVSH